jgi:hypothetical protein
MKTLIEKLKALRIYAVMCCFIPFFGIIYHHFSRFDFFNPLFFLYHALTTSAVVAVVIKYLYL